MGISDRLFALPPADAAKIEARLAALPAQTRALIERAGGLLAGPSPLGAQGLLAQVLMALPCQPDALRLQGLLLARTGDMAEAVDQGRVVALAKADPPPWWGAGR